MTHISLTGPAAGQLLCGKSREAAEKDGETPAHWPYSMTSAQEAAYRAASCPACLAVWDDSDDSELYRGDPVPVFATRELNALAVPEALAAEVAELVSGAADILPGGYVALVTTDRAPAGRFRRPGVRRFSDSGKAGHPSGYFRR